MNEIIWNSGPPPHIGWWLANKHRFPNVWSWWDGKCWSIGVGEKRTAEEAAKYAAIPRNSSALVEWSDHYPADARVPRVDPGAAS